VTDRPIESARLVGSVYFSGAGFLGKSTSVGSMSYESDEKEGGIRGNIRIVDTDVQGLEWLYCSSRLDGI
jgi:hypothetical protein